MKKTTKGALTTTAAVALLAGGAGTLANWTSAQEVLGARIHTGNLELIDTTAGGCATASFVFETGQTYVETNGATRVVPGDVLTKTCTYRVYARGVNLSAALSTAGPTQSANSSLPLVATGSYSVDGVANQGTITSADNGKTVEARIRVEFPFSAGNASQGTNKLVNGYTITATQSDPTP